ncbi:MAG: PAS domain S-box protein [Candidatus Latescibacteria bacterium]|nr:PAS domain S-box protein [Candidatus Latescibacterota bacterium]
MKPSYEDLEKQINELKNVLSEKQKLIEDQYLYHKKCDFIVNNLPDIIYQLDEDGKIVFINNTISKYGFSPEELIGSSIQNIVHPNDRDLANHHLDERRTGPRRTQDYELRLLCKYNNILDFNIRSKKIDFPPSFLVSAVGVYTTDEPESRSFTGTIGVARDITERKKARIELLKTQKYAQNIIDSSLDMIVTVDENRHIKEFNPAAEQAFGYIKEEVVGKHIHMLYADESEGQKIAEIVSKTGKYVGEITNIRKNGECFKTLLSSSYIRDDKGNTYGTVGSSRDITEILKIKKELHKNEKMYQTLFENMPVVCFTYNKSGKILSWNHAAEKIYGYSIEEAIGAHVFELIGTPMIKDAFERMLARVFSGETLYNVEWQDRNKNGDIGWRIGNTYPHLRADGTVEIGVSLHIDITERKRTGEQQRSLQKVREKVWSMRTPEDVKLVAYAIRETLEQHNVPFDDFGINIINRTDDRQIVNAYLITKDNQWLLQNEVVGARLIYEIWQKGKTAYRPNLYEKDTFHESVYIENVYHHTIHSVLDVPFCRGTLAINSAKANAFSENDIKVVEEMARVLDEGYRRTDDLKKLEKEILNHKQTEEQLSKTLNMLNTSIEQSPAGILIVDTPGTTVTYANEKALILRGYENVSLSDVPEASDLSSWEIFHLDGKPFSPNELPLPKAIIDGKPCEDVTAMIKRDDGSERIIKINAAPVKNENGEIISAVAVFSDVTENKKAEDMLRRTQFAIEHLSDAVFWSEKDGSFSYVNEMACKMLGYSKNEFYKLHITDIDPHTKNMDLRKYWEEIKLRRKDIIEALYLTKKGESIPVELSVNYFEYGEIDYLCVYARDISERKNLEDQYLQSQKMETVGRLAGGVAHDFNNLLTVITGNAELAMMGLSTQDPLYKDINEIKITADRAARLTRQLLAFSRRQITNPEVVNPNDVLMNMDKMLRRLIGENIEYVTLPHENLWWVYIDRGQIEQILTNLVVNARDAMPEGGKLTIQTANITLENKQSKNAPSNLSGNYVLIDVMDTGTGIESENLSKVFEPFFTTKEKGEGTGLGLSTCYGIIKQNNGEILIDSEPGKGTTVKIYLPKSNVDARQSVISSMSEEALDGNETILLVEDEVSLRKMVYRILNGRGYTVIEASHGEEALRLLKDYKDSIHLVITDVIMPRMGGKELGEKIASLSKDIKILYMSGYTDQSIVNHGILEPGITFIQKPFRPNDILKIIRDILDK